MIEIVTPEIAHRYLPALSMMHRLRHEVFVERMGWDVPSINQLEFDQFDAGDATYVLYRDEGGNVTGCARLLPTTVPYMLRDVPSFRPLMEGQEMPNDPLVWESSRFGATSPRTTGWLLAGMFEYALSCGVHEIITVYDTRIDRLLRVCGLDASWVSSARPVGNTMAIGARFPVTPEAVAKLRHVNRIKGQVIRNQPWFPEAMAAE